MPPVDPLLNYTAFGVSVVRWALVAVVILVTVLIFGGIKRLILRRMETWSKRENMRWLRYIEALFNKTKLFLYLAIGLFVGLTLFDIRDQFVDKGYVFVQILVIIQVGIWGSAFITVLIDRYKAEVEDDPAQLTALSAIDFLLGLAVWSIVMLMILDNLGFDITALIASLGIGGVAIALAAQKILGDLFAFFSIIVDKPFVRGDFIIVGEFMGTIEHIGIKSTRVRSLGGEQLIFSNEDLLQSRIRNYKRMQERRVVFEFGVTYSTSSDDIKAITEFIEDYITDEERARFDRAHFKEFGESSLRFEVVYQVLSAEFNVHMDVQQGILLAILDEFRDRDVHFAFPSRSVFLDGNGEEPKKTEKTADRAAV